MNLHASREALRIILAVGIVALLAQVFSTLKFMEGLITLKTAVQAFIIIFYGYQETSLFGSINLAPAYPALVVIILAIVGLSLLRLEERFK